jgi:predicted membrane protein
MSDLQRNPMSSRLAVGIIIVGLGAILLAGNLGWFDARALLRLLWPLALVVAGVIMLNDRKQHRSRTGAWVLIAIGVWLFANKLGLHSLSLGRVLVPGLFLIVGGMLVWRSLRDSRERGEGASVASDDHPEYVQSFAFISYSDLHPVLHPFGGGDIGAVMGGVRLDLRDTHMEGDQAVLDVFAFWGGIEVRVPPDWIVTSKVSTIIGGFVDSRRPSKVVPTKTLVVRGFNIMSGIEVKN